MTLIFTSSIPTQPKSDHLLVQFARGRLTPLDWSPDGQKILALDRISVNESYVWLIHVSSGEKTLLTPKAAT